MGHPVSPRPNTTACPGNNHPPLASSEGEGRFLSGGTSAWQYNPHPQRHLVLLNLPSSCLLGTGSGQHGHNPSGRNKQGVADAEGLGCISIERP